MHLIQFLLIDTAEWGTFPCFSSADLYAQQKWFVSCVGRLRFLLCSLRIYILFSPQNWVCTQAAILCRPKNLPVVQDATKVVLLRGIVFFAADVHRYIPNIQAKKEHITLYVSAVSQQPPRRVASTHRSEQEYKYYAAAPVSGISGAFAGNHGETTSFLSAAIVPTATTHEADILFYHNKHSTDVENRQRRGRHTSTSSLRVS